MASHLAYLTQLTLGSALAVSLIWLRRSNAAFELKASAPAIGSLLATPYVPDDDLVVLAIALAFVAYHGLVHGFHSGEINMLGLAWIMPLLTHTIAGAVEIPLGLVVMIAFYVFVLRRAVADHRLSVCSHAHIAAA